MKKAFSGLKGARIMGILQIKKRYSLNEIMVIVALFCVSTFALMEHSSISISAISMIKTPILLLGAVAVASQAQTILRNFFKKKYFGLYAALIVLSGMLIWSMRANMNALIGESPLRDTVRLILYLFELFSLAVILAERGKGMFALRFVFIYEMALLVITDILMLSGAVRFFSGGFESYFVGSKFSVGYMHMNALTLWAMTRKPGAHKKGMPKKSIAALTVFLVVIAIRVDCMTGIIGCVILLGIYLLLTTRKSSTVRFFISSRMLVVFLLCSVVFSFAAQWLLNLPVISFIVENVFKRDTTLTGRLNIYLQYIQKVSDHWLTGYGYGNGNVVSVFLFRYENTQNAILQWVLQVGVPTTAMLLYVMYWISCTVRRANDAKVRRTLPMIALIYTYIVLGTVETTFNMSFLMWWAFIFMLVNERRKDPRQTR